MIKRFLLLVLALSFCFTAHAENEQQFAVLSFEKGLNTHTSKWMLSDNQASEARDVRFNKKYGNVAKRTTMVQYGEMASSSSVNSLWRYYKNSDDTKYLIGTASTDIKVGSDLTGVFQTIGQNFTDGKRWDWVTYQDVAIGGNGFDQPVKYDGTTEITAETDGARSDKYLVAELGAPFCELNTGTGLDDNSWYQYGMGYYDGTNYWYSTARSNQLYLTTPTAVSTTLSDIPLGPSGTTKRYIYRTQGVATETSVSSATLYMTNVLEDNTTVTWDDTVADSTIATATPTWATLIASGNSVLAPLGNILTLHNERLWIAGNPSEQSDVNWSVVFKPDFFYSSDFVQVRPDDGDKVTFLQDWLGILTIGKTNSIQKYYTEGASTTWAISDNYSEIGCPAPDTASYSPKGIVFLGRNGIYLFNGQSVQLISDVVTPEIEDILQSNITETAGIYINNEYHLSYTSEVAGGAYNDRVLVYDMIRDAYNLDYKNIECFTAFNSGSDYGTLYLGSSANDGIVWANEYDPNELIKRYKSEFDDGTGTTVRVTGTEENPEMELAWTLTIDEAVGTIDAGYTTAKIDRPGTTGNFVTTSFLVNAVSFDKLYWNERLGATGDITLQVATGSTAAICDVAGLSSAYTDPNGTDLSDLAVGEYVRFKVNMETSNILYTPYLYVAGGYMIRLSYNKTGSVSETDYLSIWHGGWEDFKVPAVKKYLKRIKVYYTGEESTISVNFRNEEGDIDTTFDIDLDVEPPFTESTTDNKYSGLDGDKIYTYYCTDNAEGVAPIGQFWQFQISETGAKNWSIARIEVLYEAVNIYD